MIHNKLLFKDGMIKISYDHKVNICQLSNKMKVMKIENQCEAQILRLRLHKIGWVV